MVYRSSEKESFAMSIIFVLILFCTIPSILGTENSFRKWLFANKGLKEYRYKRQDDSYDDAVCLQRCQQQLLTEIAAQRSSGNVTSQNSLERYCSVIYPPTVSCFEQCRQSVYRDLSLAQLDIGKFLCSDRKNEAVKYYPCIEQTSAGIPVDVRCLIPCVNNGSYAAYTIVNPEVRVSMNLNCRELRCNTKCQIKNINQHCAPDGFRFVRDYYKYIVNTYQKQIEIIQGRNAKLWPQDCSDFQTELSNEVL